MKNENNSKYLIKLSRGRKSNYSNTIYDTYEAAEIGKARLASIGMKAHKMSIVKYEEVYR